MSHNRERLSANRSSLMSIVIRALDSAVAVRRAQNLRQLTAARIGQFGGAVDAQTLRVRGVDNAERATAVLAETAAVHAAIAVRRAHVRCVRRQRCVEVRALKIRVRE